MKWSILKRHPKVKAAVDWSRLPSIPFGGQTVFKARCLTDWYDPVMIGPCTVGEMALSAECLRQVINVVEQLEPDDYTTYLLAYYRAGLDRFGEAWRYADITTVLMAAAKLIRPQNYLEVGVRRGRSMAMVAATSPDCNIVGFDFWIPNYAGIPNPGPDFVRAEMSKLGHSGSLELISGDSHKALPHFFSEHNDLFFDLITVDGDHSKRGAKQDLLDVLPRLKVGGLIVFDDICHPLHMYLADVWQRVVVQDPHFITWHFKELGYGVAFAIRRNA